MKLVNCTLILTFLLAFFTTDLSAQNKKPIRFESRKANSFKKPAREGIYQDSLFWFKQERKIPRNQYNTSTKPANVNKRPIQRRNYNDRSNNIRRSTKPTPNRRPNQRPASYKRDRDDIGNGPNPSFRPRNNQKPSSIQNRKPSSINKRPLRKNPPSKKPRLERENSGINH